MTKGNGSTRRHDAATQLDERLGAIKESVKQIVGRGEERMGAIRHRVNEARDQARTRSTVYVDRVTDLIKSNPLKAVGLAFGIGFISMRLFRR